MIQTLKMTPTAGLMPPTLAITEKFIRGDRLELEVPDDFQPRRFDRPVMQPA